jgi:hypothetical protein
MVPDLHKHPATLRVLRALDAVTNKAVKENMKISSLGLRQNHTTRLVVENVDLLDIGKLQTWLPRSSKVFIRSALNSKYQEKVSSRLEIYYSVKNKDYVAILICTSFFLMCIAYFFL